jgi:hypothetical protein
MVLFQSFVVLMLFILFFSQLSMHDRIISINRKIKKIMASQQRFQDVLTRIQTAVNNLETNQGIPAAQEDAFLTEFEGLATRLEQLASPSGNTDVPGEPVVV